MNYSTTDAGIFPPFKIRPGIRGSLHVCNTKGGIRRWWSHLALFLGLAAGLAQAGEPADFRPVLKAQAARYPEMQVQDCYKLVYQACLGSEHAVGDPALAARWLERELATMGPGPAEPAVDPIAPDGSVVRVHLRPYLARGGEAGKLAAAFVETAAKIHGSREKLAEAWMQVVELARAGQLPFPAEAAENFWRQMVQADYPAVHHSARFSERYRPAYRVVAGELARGLLPAQ